ncbi:hypothetical protein Back11_54550 [Paenibacillus baekrokdamisoli]|uniref:Uncharacterized protein n=1 Tax=Paenibacillus baekrokdamisoli TaxID=1712516 RepID=A0A3G9IYX9_9BACL|nr:hypothetical protein [Paenibacillus baekrokdamisoli]MBB3071907.1 hypothetical protein [Paenibacillus baekrokdamisoli]BBH24110.1 hypothetical protein Back11_54550 [Paenibacillus baekrokdamisoli]
MKRALSAVLSFTLVLVICGIGFPSQHVYAAETKINLSTSMVTNESANGNPTALVDEQTIAGDPANGSGGAPSTPWFGGYNASDYPIYAYIDLGQNYNLSSIYVRDSYSSGNFIVSSGSPGSWTTLFTDPLTNYMTWNAHAVAVTTRYVRVNLVSGGDVDEIVIYGTPSAGGGDTTPPDATTDLAAGTATSSSVQLTWTGKGDDGSTGTPTSYDVRYSTSAITNANWASATPAAGVPAPAAAGTTRTMTVNGLLAGTTYYFALKTSDEVPNISALSNVVSKATTASADTTPPGATTDLVAGTATSSSVQLTWTGQGDDGSTGTPASYEVRYSTATITSANWASATLATGVPAPAVAGTVRTMTVNGLSASTTYYFALKTSDEVPNVSALSNVVSKTTTASTVSGKVVITPSMYLNESFYGDPSALTDEQTIAGDPRAGTGGNPTNGWDMGYNSIYHPGSTVIDLGADYAITDLYLYDGSGTGNVKVSTGTPFSWDLKFTDPMSNYNVWNAHSLPVTTRYIQIVKDPGAAMPEIVLYGTALGTPAAPPTPVTPTLPTMDQLIGINAFIDDPLDKMKVAGFVREYHNWQWDEGDIWPFGTIATGYPGYPNNQNKFAPSYAGGGWNFDSYYSGLKNAGITAVPVYTCSVSWLTLGNCDKPIKNGSGRDPLLPASYIEHADHMFQVAARYGSTAVADNKLKLASGQPRSTGLNTIQYYEDWNEQDAWWAGRNVYFNPYEYAAMASADYDGHQGTMGTTVGIKNADPNAKMVMGGLAEPSLSIIRAIKFWADFKRGGSVPFDAINIHHYSTNGTNQTSGTTGISPEADNLVQKLKAYTDYRDRYMQGKEVWISEFGYDTNQGSPVHAPIIGTTSQYETQANWLVRSYLAAAAAGISKAAMFMLRDTDASSSQQFASSGLVSSQATGQTPKISWYYVYTLKNQLTGMRYAGEQASGNSNVKIYKFKSATGSNGGYVLWCPTANNTTVSNYQLSLTTAASTASKVTLTDGNTNGVSSALSIAANKVTVNVSEKPVFVLVNDIQ